MAFNQIFWFAIIARFHRNRCDNSNSDTDFDSKLYQKLVDFVVFVVIFDINWLLINFYDLFDIYNDLLIEMDQFYIEIGIIDSISSLDFESDWIRWSNSDTDFDSTMTIRYATPNRISLVDTGIAFFKIWLQTLGSC